MEISVPRTCSLAQLEELCDTGNLFAGAKVHLYKSAMGLTPLTVLADFDEADFDGYAPSSAVAVWTTGYAPNGLATAVGEQKIFASTGPFVNANTIYGYYVTDGAGTAYLWGRQFTTPIAVSAEGQLLSVIPSYPAYGPAV